MGQDNTLNCYDGIVPAAWKAINECFGETPAERVARLEKELAEAKAEAERAKQTYGENVAAAMFTLTPGRVFPQSVMMDDRGYTRGFFSVAESFRDEAGNTKLMHDLRRGVAAAVDAAYAKGAEDMKAKCLKLQDEHYRYSFADDGGHSKDVFIRGMGEAIRNAK